LLILSVHALAVPRPFLRGKIKVTNRTIRKIVWHCSATPEGRDVSSDEIRRWHTDPPPAGRGWRAIGYHYVIRLDSSIEPGREEHEVGAHVIAPCVNPMAMRDTGPATTHGAHAREAPARTDCP
jgi:hypothetical protein